MAVPREKTVYAERSGDLSIAPALALDDTRLKPADHQMLMWLGRHADGQGWCRPSQKLLAAGMGITQQAVSARLRRLADSGWIEIHQQRCSRTGARLSAHYRIVWEYELPDEYTRRLPTQLTRPPQREVVRDRPISIVRPPQREIVGVGPPPESPPQREIVGSTTPATGAPQPDVVTPTNELFVATGRPIRTPHPDASNALPESDAPAAEDGADAPRRPRPKASRSRSISQPREEPRTPAPDTIEISAGLRQWAQSVGFTDETIASEMRLCLLKHAQLGTLSARWVATFRSWLEHEITYAERDERPLGEHPAPLRRRSGGAGTPGVGSDGGRAWTGHVGAPISRTAKAYASSWETLPDFSE